MVPKPHSYVGEQIRVKGRVQCYTPSHCHSDKYNCDCGPYCSTQKINPHSSHLGTQPSPHQWNMHLWDPSRALLPATAPAAEGTLAPAEETAPRGCYPYSARWHPLLLFYTKSLHSRCVSSHQAFLPCSPIHDESMVALTHVSKPKTCPLRRLLPNALENTNSQFYRVLDAAILPGASTKEWHRRFLLRIPHLDFKCSFHFPSSSSEFYYESFIIVMYFLIILVHYYLAVLVTRFITAWKLLC